MSMTTCPFCIRILRDDYDERSGGVVTFEPLNPVTPGHRLFVPSVHITWRHPGAAMEMGHCLRAAVRWATTRMSDEFNLITSCGEAATQTIDHLHLHLVPRETGDGLALPWTAP